MSGNNTSNSQALIRSELWAQQLEEILHENLLGMPIVRQVDFPDGDKFTMASIGVPLVRTKPEGAEVTFDAIDNGESSIVMNEPVIAANSVSKKFMQDSMYAAEMLANIPVLQARAIMEHFETDTFALAMKQFLGTGNLNLINGVAHRKIAGGTNEVMQPQDFAFAKYSLLKAKVPTNNLIAIVDPSVAYTLETSTNLVNVSNNPHWEGIVETGMDKNFRFIKNVFGFDIFESNLLPIMNETIGGKTTTAGKANIFMSMGDQMLLPFVLAWREKPNMVVEYDNKLHQTEIQTNARWGSGVVKDENLVVIASDTDQVT